ncbi:succinyl-diaminopimelate desuccinylase [Desulfonatronum thiosulfatophilum]|uniref:Succinyl-diaminopimelate desuccinylase n=1 Tax=Desulfonatronum thiosulfatophilum TaxID=617002 RepID=A0A1G6BQW3_9BACT|nr:M20 family metallo-hydrolase [Desulfonatronum thiosulfatophilum]SDB22989.1 succinyl-diaminopimelate desuccinylase [Desulfonatronum thiosulfatophilum]
MLDFLDAHIRAQRERVITLQRDLVAIPALGPTNGGQGEKEKAEYLLRLLHSMGIDQVEEIPAPDNDVDCGFRPNVAAVVPGRDASRTFWVISHTDIVPPGDLELWTSPPYELRVDGDLIHGRGVEDNHQGIVASLLVAEALIAAGEPPAINFGMLFVADEETASSKGLDYILNHRRDLFGPRDLILIPDFGSASGELVEVAEKSLFWVKFSVYGKQCHASTPQKGVNTLVAASDLIMRLRSLYTRFGAQDPLFFPPGSTFEATKKEANVPNINTIPGLDVFYLDCRVLVQYSLDEIGTALDEICAEVVQDHGVRVEWDVVQEVRAAPATPVESPIVRRMLAAIRAVHDNNPSPMGIGGGTVASFLRRLGIPTVVWSTLLGTAHQPNEHSSIKNTLADAQVMARVLCMEDEQ